MGSAGRLSRDWRIKTIVPVIVVNVLAFAGLYALMYHFALSNLIQSYRSSAAILLDELQLSFDDPAIAHPSRELTARLARHAAKHGLSALTIYGRDMRPLFVGGRLPSSLELAEATRAARVEGLTWAIGKDNRLLFGRPLVATAQCQQCHGPAPMLGVMQLGFDLTAPFNEARTRVREKFAVAGVLWLAILALLIWTGRMVIARPLAEIERTLAGARGATDGSAPSRDLDEMASHLNTTLWDLVHAQRRREEEVARMMVRAEQMAALGEVAAGLTHEIKNPLAGVIAVLEILRVEGDTNAQHHELFDQMLSELRRVTSTVEGLLRLARPQPPLRAAVDMSRIVREITSLFTARLRRQGVTLEVQMSDVPTLQLDMALMTQLLVNLLTNSLQATDRGGSVSVVLAAFPDRRGIVLAVQDSGRGIPPDKVDHVFDPFFTTKEEGTGLGLAICRQIVEQHGGTISLESEEGHGTRVVVLLPDLTFNTSPGKEELHGGTAAG
jgi:signal transduction histidine kinase